MNNEFASRKSRESGFVQKSDWFPTVFQTKLLPFPDFSVHFVNLNENKNITKLAFKY